MNYINKRLFANMNGLVALVLTFVRSALRPLLVEVYILHIDIIMNAYFMYVVRYTRFH